MLCLSSDEFVSSLFKNFESSFLVGLIASISFRNFLKSFGDNLFEGSSDKILASR